jgi:PGAP1-like protein
MMIEEKIQVSNIKKPSWTLHFSELFRAILETIRGMFFLFQTPKSDIGKGQTIVVIPGLVSSDISTYVLRKYLIKLGYNAMGWEMGHNLGRLESLPPLIEKVGNLSKNQNQKIILIGWSMGGIFAREVAKAIPGNINKVITIGSPFGNVNAPNHAKWVYDLLNDEKDLDHHIVNQIHMPAPVPTTALYSKVDGMVPWQACMEHEENENYKNIEINSSHFGMGANPNVMKVVGDILR